MKSSHMGERTLAASVVAFCIGLAVTSAALADDVGTDPSIARAGCRLPRRTDVGQRHPMPRWTACATVRRRCWTAPRPITGTFADASKVPSYADPAVSSSNVVGRTALRESAAVAMDAANTPGLQPEIADPMRIWSLGATKLLVKMGLRIPGESLNSTATEMNNQATKVQQACAAAGTHA